MSANLKRLLNLQTAGSILTHASVDQANGLIKNLVDLADPAQLQLAVDWLAYVKSRDAFEASLQATAARLGMKVEL